MGKQKEKVKREMKEKREREKREGGRKGEEGGKNKGGKEKEWTDVTFRDGGKGLVRNYININSFHTTSRKEQ